MKFARMIAIAILAGGSAVWADAPTTRPAATTRPSAASESSKQTHKPSQNVRRLARPRGLFWMLGGAANTAGVRPATAAEWDDMMEFLSSNSPSRWMALSSLTKVPNTAPVKLEAIRKWRNYVFYRQNFPEVADQMEHRFHLEDDLFAITLSVQEHPEDLDEFRDKIHDKVADMVKVDFAERQLRIDKLEQTLEAQKLKLAQDEAAQDKQIDETTNRIMNRLERQAATIASSATTKPDGDGESTDKQPPATEQHDAILNVTGGTDSGGK